MRMMVGMLLLALGACGSENQPEEPAIAAPAAAATPMPAASAPASSNSEPLMAIPQDPKALQRLAAMGYTIHEEQGHLHAPGLTGCPAMSDGPAM